MHHLGGTHLPVLDDLLAKGYFPKELPTPFTTASYATAMAATPPTVFTSGRVVRRLCTHPLARPGMTTRVLGIPDPVNFYRLANLVATSWPTINTAISRSKLSLTKPIDDPTHHRALVPQATAGRAEARAEHRARARYLVDLDIAQFYPSVYTHTLDWAVRGKSVAKALRRATGLGPLLDLYTRNANDGQTVGIPIGPDTSLALGELILANVDVELLRSRSRIHGFRYYDDYELYAATRTDAEAGMSAIQGILADWQLAVNPYKVEIRELPQPIEDEWLSVLKRVSIRTHSSQERSDLNALFDESFRLARRFPRDHVISYALGHFITRDRLERHRVQRVNWPHLEKLLMQACLGEPGVLPDAAVLLNWAQLRGWPIDRPVLAKALATMITENAARGHASEVAWAIWTAIALGCKLPNACGRAASRMRDDVVALTALHARSLGLLGGVAPADWQTLMTAASLAGEHWLLAYEAYETRLAAERSRHGLHRGRPWFRPPAPPQCVVLRHLGDTPIAATDSPASHPCRRGVRAARGVRLVRWERPTLARSLRPILR